MSDKSLAEINSKSQTIYINPHYANEVWLQLCQNIEVAIASALTVYKNDNTAFVGKIQVDQQFFIVKQFKIRSLGHALKQAFRRSRARRNWHNAQQLAQYGISTFTPIALIEKRYGPLLKGSYLITSYIDGISAIELYGYNALWSPSWEVAGQAIVLLIERLAQLGISHRDLNLSNILLVNQQPWLIDLDGMRQYQLPCLKRWAAAREKRRFMQNWYAPPSISKQAEHMFRRLFEQHCFEPATKE